MKTILLFIAKVHKVTRVSIRYTCIISMIFVFIRCNDLTETTETGGNNQFNVIAELNYNDQLKREFGSMMAKGIFEHKEVRDLIKEESLKRFNHDYEVLYQMIKNKPLSNGKSLRQLLIDDKENEGKLLEIEQNLPLLTIMVPELPENSFSAQKWDTNTQIPFVGLRIFSPEGVPILMGNGEEFLLPNDLTPGFPVIVIKDNERVKVSNFNSSLSFSAPGSDFTYEFIAENFSNLKEEHRTENPAKRVAYSIDQTIIDARNIMNSVPGGWQRDYIYYGLTPENDRGPISYDFSESITFFRFIYGREGYEKISQASSGDPRAIEGMMTNDRNPPTGAAGWTDGQFEFMVNARINSTRTSNGVSPGFFAKGHELFDIEYELFWRKRCRWYQGCFGKDLYAYRIKNITPKDFYPKEVILINWDLNVYSSDMEIAFSEVDDSQVITDRISSESEFAGNFSIDFKKIGLKFGASAKRNLKSERVVVTTVGSDDLRNAIIEFGHMVLFNSTGLPHRTREYSTGLVRFSVEPVRVENF